MTSNNFKAFRIVLLILGGLLNLMFRMCAPALRIKDHESLTFPSTNINFHNTPLKVWETHLPSPIKKAFSVSSDKILVTTYRGELFLIDANTGKKASRIWIPYRRPVNVLMLDKVGKRLYTSSPTESNIFGFDLNKGKVFWKVKIDSVDLNMVQIEQKIYLIKNYKSILEISPLNSKMISRIKLPSRVTGGLYLSSDSTLLVLCEDGFLRQYSKELKFQGSTYLGLNAETISLMRNDTLLAVDSKGRLIAIAGKNIINKFFSKPLYSLPWITNNQIFIAFADGEVRAYDYQTDMLLWSWKGKGLVNHPLMKVDNTILVTFARGLIFALDSRNGNILYQLDVGYPPADVVVENDKLLVFRKDRRVICWKWEGK